MSTGQKSYIIVILAKSKNIKFIIPKNSELSSRTHGVTVIDVGSLSF